MLGFFTVSIPFVYFLQPTLIFIWMIMGFLFFSVFLSPNIILFITYRKNDLNKKVTIHGNQSIQINSCLIDKSDILEIIIHRYKYYHFSTSPWKDFNYWVIRTISGQEIITTCLTMESDVIEKTYQELTITVKSNFQSLSKGKVNSILL
jgi:hypothetical protein